MNNKLIPIIAAMTLVGCGGGGGGGGSTPTPAPKLAPFSLNSILPSSGTKAISLQWDKQNLNGVTYDLCEYDEEKVGYCNVLNSVTDAGVGSVILGDVTGLSDTALFVRAKYGSEVGYSNHMSLSDSHLEMIFTHRLLTGADETAFVYNDMNTVYQESVDVTAGVLTFNDDLGNVEHTASVMNYVPTVLLGLDQMALEANTRTTSAGNTFDGRHFIIEWDDGTGLKGISLLEFTGVAFVEKEFFSVTDLGWSAGDITGVDLSPSVGSGFLMFKTIHTDTAGIGGRYHTLTDTAGGYALTNDVMQDLDPKQVQEPVISSYLKDGVGYATTIDIVSGETDVRVFPTVGAQGFIAGSIVPPDTFNADVRGQIADIYVDGKLVINQHYIGAVGGDGFDSSLARDIVVQHRFNLDDLANANLVGETLKAPLAKYAKDTLDEGGIPFNIYNNMSADQQSFKGHYQNIKVTGLGGQHMYSQISQSPVVVP